MSDKIALHIELSPPRLLIGATSTITVVLRLEVTEDTSPSEELRVQVWSPFSADFGDIDTDTLVLDETSVAGGKGSDDKQIRLTAHDVANRLRHAPPPCGLMVRPRFSCNGWAAVLGARSSRRSRPRPCTSRRRVRWIRDTMHAARCERRASRQAKVLSMGGSVIKSIAVPLELHPYASMLGAWHMYPCACRLTRTHERANRE